MSTDLDATIRTFLARFDLLVGEFQRNADDITAAQTLIDRTNERQIEIRGAVEQLEITATQFGFDLWGEYTKRDATPERAAQDEEPDTRLTMPLSAIQKPDPPTVREFILVEAEKSFPYAVRAAALRQRMQEQYGVEVHEKTFGMTLYRLSKMHPPQMRREGRQDWFFVPDTATAAGAVVAGRII